MAAPSGYVPPSPFVGQGNLELMRAGMYDRIRASEGATYADVFPIKGPNPLALRPMAGSANTGAATSTVQTTDLTLLGYALGANGLPATATGDNIDPFWTIDESTIIFSSNNTTDGHYHLFAMPAGGGTPVQLTSDTGNERWPTLSSNGNQIVFCASANATGGPYVLMTGQYSGNAIISPTAITPNTLDVQHPSLSGSTVIFGARTSGTNPYHIWSVTTTGLSLTQVTTGPADEEDPAYSPTGTVIAFDSNATAYVGNTSQGTTGTRDIFVAYFTGSNIEKFTNDAGTTNIDPVWTQPVSNPFLNPNGAHLFIFFSSNRTTTAKFDIFFLRATPSTTPQTSPPVIDTEGTNHEGIGANTAVEVDTSDPTHQYNNLQPAVSSMQTFVQVAYATPRYLVNGGSDNPLNDAYPIFDNADIAAVNPQIDNEPTNTATNPATSDEIFSSRLFDIDPPALLRYSTGSGEIIHVFEGGVSGLAASAGTVTHNMTPGSQVTFVARLSDRQTGVGQVYLQIKDPNSKYQDAANLEHKLYSSPISTGETADLYTGPASPGFNGQAQAFIGYLNNGGNFVGAGQEVDCQDIAATNGVDATNPANFSTPVYTPGIQDADFLSANFFPASAEQGIWLKMQPVPAADQDGNGGVLYYATWTTPTTPSDWYLDLVAYDNAQWPVPYDLQTGFEGGNTNWRIYDNAWGFTTAPFPTNGQHGVLVVNDYALPQKFFNDHFGTYASGNVPPSYYGAESYVTDIDVVKADGGISDKAVAPYEAEVPITGKPPVIEPLLQVNDAYNPTAYANALGVNSYNDAYNEHGAVIDGAEDPVSQQYDIWRILARGPIPQSTLNAYAPTIEQTPLPTDPTKTQPVEVANACVLWISPVAGDEFAGPGTITDVATQNEIDAFLKLGGRIFVEGQDVGFALTADGTLTTASPSDAFYTNDLLAKFTIDGIGFEPSVAALAAAGGQKDYISHDAYFNNNAALNIVHNSMFIPGTPVDIYEPPSAGTVTLANGNYNLSFMASQVERTDASLSDYAFGADGHGYIDGITPVTPATEPLELSGTGQYGTSGLFYSINTPNAQETYLTSIIAYGSFGLENVSQELFLFTPPGGTVPLAYLKEYRTDLMHNMICFMRTGRLTGQVVNSSNGGLGEPNVVVSAQLENIGGQVYTALTDGQGNYTIQGLVPGFYRVTAFKTGFTVQHDQSSGLLHGGDFLAVSALVVNPTPTGILTVTVVDASNSNPIAGAVVTATPTTGGTPITGTTGANGVVVLNNITSGQYNVTANGSAAGYGTGSDPNNPITVPPGGSATSLIKLNKAPAIIYGNVTDTSGNPITSGTITVTNSSNTVIGSATIGQLPANPVSATESYQVSVPGGTNYSVTAVSSGFQPVTISGVNAPGGQNTQVNFTSANNTGLPTANPGSLYGLVGVGPNAGNSPIGGVTVTVTDSNGISHTYTTLGTTSTAPDGGKENWSSGTLPAGPYTVTVNIANAPPAENAIITSGQAVRVPDFDIQPTFNTGLTLFSSPYDFSNSGLQLSTILGYANPKLAVWDPSISQYDITGQTPPAGHTNLANGIVIGQGYWANFPGPVFLDVAAGNPASTQNPFSITLQPGWNMIGDPFISNVNISDFRVADSHGNMYSWTQAAGASLHLVGAILYSWDQANSQYAEHYVGSTVGKPTDLNPTVNTYVGYWIQAFSTCAIQISPPPLAPSTLVATPGTKQVSLTWTGGVGATSYNIYKGTTSGGETLLTSGITTTTYTDSAAVTGTTYYYYVTSANAAGESLKSNEASATAQ